MEERILLVEDNKTLAKLLAKKMENSIGVSVDVAYSMQEAQAFILGGRNYFLALLDLNLPDAPDGEIVDYVLSKDILVIVLTGNIDEKTKQTFINKDIVDYVYKSNMNDVNYIFTTIDRLYKNRNFKVMIVDDAMMVRNEAKKMLESQQFGKVFAAAHGEEALGYFEDHPDIKLVLTDYNMPVIDGLELTMKLREKYTKNELGIIAITGSTEEEQLASTFLKTGANDFVTKPFKKEELICRVNALVEALENIEIIGNMANTDFMTGAYNRRYFFDAAQKYLKDALYNNEMYAVAMLDIDFFKKVNDTYGHDAGDLVIKKLAKFLKDETKGADVVARFGGEEFCVLLKNVSKEDAVTKFVHLRSKIASSSLLYKDQQIKFTVSIGITFGQDDVELAELLEEADDALYNAKENGRNRVEIYER